MVRGSPGWYTPRLNARRTSYSPRVTSQFLLSGIAYCGYCGNKLIGVSRKQAWKRKSGERIENQYRYYQCESRTNQSVCGYHTRHADELEDQVRASIDAVFRDGNGVPQAGDEAAVLAERERERERIASRMHSVDKRLESIIMPVEYKVFSKLSFFRLNVFIRNILRGVDYSKVQAILYRVMKIYHIKYFSGLFT